ncbi:lysophospholipid acyltransferase family protein [Williamsia sp. 1135]|uniref:lysophospholipid acyltransferase family protein n=1 Tax=Williamsia sp. 1135 TaxID=1889262 RepID=UPI00143C144A|nr:lysophospholipid acyltransferase family protein [Williamsia sp. 1135]
MFALLTTAVVVLSVGMAIGLLPRSARARYVRTAAHLLITSLGIRIEVHDDRPDHLDHPDHQTGSGPRDRSDHGLIVSNHISFLDVLAIASVRPARFVAKAELATWPVIGPITRRLAVIPIRRESLRELPAVVDTARGGLLAGDNVGVFPEGTTRCGRGGGRFRPALFQAAVDTGVPIYPVVVSFHTSTGELSTAACFIGADDIGDTMRRVLAAKGLVVRIQMCEQQLPGDDRRELALRCERVVFGHPVALTSEDTTSVALAA